MLPSLHGDIAKDVKVNLSNNREENFYFHCNKCIQIYFGEKININRQYTGLVRKKMFTHKEEFNARLAMYKFDLMESCQC